MPRPVEHWEVCSKELDLLVNVFTGTYYGCSNSYVRKGRLFSTGLGMSGKPPLAYHCIAWNEV